MLRHLACLCLMVSLPVWAQAYSPYDDGTAEKNRGPALTEREKAVHALNRMAFGPRPGEVERVMEMGVENWMRRQLTPSTIDNHEANASAKDLYPSVGASNGNLLRRLEGGRYGLQQQLRRCVVHRAIYSERQFEEVILAFWREHFSVDQRKEEVGAFANNWEATVLRRHAFGRFEDMLLASARHPAMLVYLDNIISQKPLTEHEKNMVERYGDREHVPSSVRALMRHRGLNENYARELMELHTLGVDRQYTQQDVTELARVLTGWSADWGKGAPNVFERRGNEGFADYGFKFNKAFHDHREKVIFGTRLRGGGEKQGVQVICALARHKYTADFISRKLCAYLLRDQPSEALVVEVAEVFRQTNGDLSKVYAAIVLSDDFFFRQNHRVKFKTPFEFVVSSIRATGAAACQFREIDEALSHMGQPIYQCPDPTGWYDSAEAWLDPGVMVYRWVFALDLANNEIGGVNVSSDLRRDRPAAELKQVISAQLLPAGLSPRTSRIIDETLGKDVTAEQMLGVLLGSPDFQQH